MLNQFTHSDVDILSDDIAYSGFYQLRKLTLRHRLFKGGWGKTFSRELFHCYDAVGVLLIDMNLELIALVEQVRVGVIGSDISHQRKTSPWLLELVAGLIDNRESPEDIAIRESVEEAGIDIERLEKISEYYSSPGGSNEFFYLFAGKADLSEAGGVFGLEAEGEDIRVHVLKISEVWDLLAQGEISNAHTIIAVQWLKLNYSRLQSQWL